MSGKLSLVATPIGSLEDITLRALRVLSEADFILAEDTRHTAVLLKHHHIEKPLRSCHEFNEAAMTGEVVRSLSGGARVALVSDAGTPLISDPGFRVVRSCIEQGVPIEVVPGPCAAVAALTVSGLPTHEFHFFGFLSNKSATAEKKLRELAELSGTLIFYESPYRVVRTLEQIAEVLPGRKLVVARELTKKFEEVVRGSAAEVLSRFQGKTPKGEFVIMVGPVAR